MYILERREIYVVANNNVILVRFFIYTVLWHIKDVHGFRGPVRSLYISWGQNEVSFSTR